MASEVVVNEFVAEAREHLGNAEYDLLAVESCGEADFSEIIDRLFRALHSIKGASGTFGFPAVMDLSHAMENALLVFRKGEASPDHEKINDLLNGVDKLKCMIDDIHSSSNVDCSRELERLNAMFSAPGELAPGESAPRPSVNEAGPAALDPGSSSGVLQPSVVEIKDPGDSTVAFLPEADKIGAALAMQHFVFAIRTDSENQLSDDDFSAKLQEFGQCLAKAPGAEKQTGPSRHYLFSTVLEPDLVGAALDISDDRICPIAPEILQQALSSSPPPPRVTPRSRMVSGPVQAPSQPAQQEQAPAPETIRVSVGLLDTLINLAGELVLGRNQLRQILDATVDTNPRLRTVIQNVNLVTSEMQAHILQMRMQPLKNIFGRMHRLVRELCDQLSKEVELTVEGGQVELDKSILEKLIDPLVHILRNCVDHGIETAEERIAQGKPARGRIHLLASHEGGQVNITVSDDGAGIDTGAIVQKAVAQGILGSEDAKRLRETDKLGLLFLPGFSTAKQVTNVSGRGVGMDVVKTNIESFGGHIDIDSVKGSGTTLRIRIPLTLAIISSLIVGAADQRFAVPQVNVKELVCVPVQNRRLRVEKVGDAPVLRLREQLLPLVRLTDVVGLSPEFMHPMTGVRLPERRQRIADRREAPESRQDETERRRSRQGDLYIVVLRVVGNLFGLIVDELFDIEEIVVKPLSDHIRDCRCFAGSTIMGDGRVAMILDASGIASSAGLSFAEVKREQLRRLADQTLRQISSTPRIATLVFKGAPQEHFALPLSRIARLEKITREAVIRIGNNEFITYCGKVLPLMRLDAFLPVSPLASGEGELHVIIPKSESLPMGILISQVIDVVEAAVAPEKTADTPRGFAGSAVLEGRITGFLDMEELVRMFKKEISIN